MLRPQEQGICGIGKPYDDIDDDDDDFDNLTATQSSSLDQWLPDTMADERRVGILTLVIGSGRRKWVKSNKTLLPSGSLYPEAED